MKGVFFLKSGLEIKSMDVDTFVRLNDLKEVTNPIMLIRNVPTPSGVLSYEIFGVSQKDRRSRMAYIDLHGHYLRPLAAKKLKAFDRKLSDIAFSTRKFVLKDGELVQDDINGRTGPEFLYEIWGKVKTKKKETIITKEVEEYFKVPRDDLFITKYPVIPAFTRDINHQSGAGKPSSAEINKKYCSIISYCQSMSNYTDSFTQMKYLTQGRVQTLLVDIYDLLVITKVKGNPSKFGMLRRFLLSKNIDYSARIVISAPILTKDTVDDVQVKFGYATVPLAYTLSCFFPFMVYHLKRFFDAQFIEGGYHPSSDKSTERIIFNESFDENYISKLITKYINSPSSRFDVVTTPMDINGKTHKMRLVGRFMKQNTTLDRDMTLTDLLYMIAVRATEDKHVYITRYPLDNYNGQFAARVMVSSTIRTDPVMIGDKIYQFFPRAEGDPANSFIDTLVMSNTYIGAMGADNPLKSWVKSSLRYTVMYMNNHCERLTSGVQKYLG